MTEVTSIPSTITMKKHQRVRKNTEFSNIIGQRKSLSSTGFILYISPKKEEKARVGLSVGKKLGKAVVRTRVKRQVRALIDSVYTFNEPFDSIVIVRPAFSKLDFDQRKKMLEELHDKALKKFAVSKKKHSKAS